MIELKTPKTPGLNEYSSIDKNFYKILLGTVKDYVKNAEGQIWGLLLAGNNAEAPAVRARLTTLSKNVWAIPQIGDLVLYGYIYGDITNPVVLSAIYPQFGEESYPGLVKYSMPNGAIFQVDKDGNMSFTIPGTSLLSSVGNSEIKVTGNDKDLTIDTTKGNININAAGDDKNIGLSTTKGNINITVAGSGKKMTLQFNSGPSIEINENNIIMKVASGKMVDIGDGGSALALLSELSSLISSFNTHTHPTASGPTGVPIVSAAAAVGTVKLKGK